MIALTRSPNYRFRQVDVGQKQEIYMVGHKFLIMHRYTESLGTIADTVDERSSVIIAGEANVAVVSTLDDVNSVSGRVKS
jgi:hypothetical protein